VATSRADLPSASIGETQRTVLDERIERSLDRAHHRSILRVETRPRGNAIETLRGFDSRRLHCPSHRFAAAGFACGRCAFLLGVPSALRSAWLGREVAAKPE